MTSDVLERLCRRRAADVAAARARRPLEELRAAGGACPPARSLVAAITSARAAGRVPIVAEIKRASPSRGLIHDELDVAGRARAYAEGGAIGISVLTEPHEFLGSDEDLRQVRAAVTLPILRKDFVVDPYQIWEARELGADVVLLIVAVLGERLREFLAEVRAAGLEALVEVHTAAELELALASEARLLGINARNLHTFETRLEWVEELLREVPEDRLVVAESGIFDRADIDRLAAAGAAAFLVGEALMRTPDPRQTLRAWGAGG